MEKKWIVAEKISEDIVSQLLYSRGLTDKKAIGDFFNPPAPEVIVAQHPNYLKKIDSDEVEKAVGLIKKSIDDGRPIVVHGDYDVDGICGTAILCQTLKSLGANVTPFVPDRFEEGYGLSVDSIDRISNSLNPKPYPLNPLLISTDCGISAVGEVKYAKERGFDVIITDHHSQGQALPEADAIVWTDELAGAGVAWLLAQTLGQQSRPTAVVPVCNDLDLVALATIADVQPLTGVNRALVKYGLAELNRGSDPGIGSDPGPGPGLAELIKVAGLEGKEIGTYEVGWMLAPRLNASGRLGNAADSLKLLLTDDPTEAREIAAELNRVNQERQQMTQKMVAEARRQVNLVGRVEKLLVLQHENWHEGVIGLVAGEIKEEFYRPVVVISKGEKISKGSARSVSGFNIVEALHQCSEFVLDAGGHAMAAGLTIKTSQIEPFREKLISVVAQQLTEETLTPVLKIDVEVPLQNITWDLLKDLKKFEPFGVGNPRPVFLTKSVRILSVRPVGSNGKHLKFTIMDIDDVTGKPCPHLSVIGFGFGEWASKLRRGDLVDIVYNLEENHWNGRRTLQLKLKDLRPAGKNEF